MRWLELNPEASMDEIVRKTKDIELQQPYIARTVLKMTAKNLDNMTRQYPKDTETQEYLIIVTDSTGTTVTDIVYVDLATLFPLDVYIV
jgi:sigma54-dependent transcription regulator